MLEKPGSLLGLITNGIYQRDRGMKNNKNKENKEPSKGKVGRPPFVPADEDRAVVKLLVACGMSQDRVCLRIRGNDGKPICEATLKRHFAHELMVGKVEVETIVLTQFMAAIMRGARWASFGGMRPLQRCSAPPPCS